MEGCPRSLMLNVDLKESFPTEFTPPLKTYIRDHYNEDADSYKNECSQLEQLRTASLRPSHDHSGCSTLRRYYAQLQFLQSRFPLGEGGAVNVQFTWTDLYSEEPISLSDIRFEQAAILHNLAALHSQLGCQEDRTAEEGMKVACTHFQAAAGIFQFLKVGSFCRTEHFIDHFASDAFFDMAGNLLQLYINVMLGQAQECLLEKSILDSRKDSLIARISMQVHDYYNQALQFLESQGPSYVGFRKAKLWTKSLKIKCCHYLAVSYIYMSNNADENQKFGEKVAYLKAASQKITEAQKASKGQPERTQEVLQFVVDVVSNKYQGAVKDNDFIYHEAVPELDALPEIKAAPLVKPIPFQPCDSSVSGPDIFQRLIPIEAHTDSSLYSEEKAKLLRRYVSSIDQKNQLLSKALADLHIDDLLEPEGYDTLPAAVKQKSDSLKKDGNLKEVENNIEELTKIGSKVEDLLTSLVKMLEEDMQKEKELLELVGPMTPPPERKDFEKELEQCQQSHKKAMQTNSELMKVFNEHKHNLVLLSGPSEGLIAALPSLNIIDTPIDDGAVQRLRDLISKVDHMKSQRKQLEAELRKELADDDITQLLVTREDGNKMVYFEEQLKKHDGKCALIQANLDAQPKILKALTEANAKYAPTRQAVKETAQRRDDAVQSFILSHDTFFELKEKLSRGLRFYQGLEKNVLKLEENLKEFYENRKKEMAKIEEKEKKAKERAKPPPVRPSAVKPDHLVHPPASSVPVPSASHYPGGPMIPNPGMRPGVPNLTPEGILLHPRIPGGAFPPTSFPRGPPPHPPDGRFNPSGSPRLTGRAPFSTGDPRVQTPAVLPQPVPEHRVPQTLPSQVSIPPVNTAVQPHSTVPFSQGGPRGPTPAEHLIHSTPRMSYPVPVGPSIRPGSQPGFPPGHPGETYQVPQPPGHQPHGHQLPGQKPLSQQAPNQYPSVAQHTSGPQSPAQSSGGQKPTGHQPLSPFAVGQVHVPGGPQGLPSYDQAKLIQGFPQLDRTPQPPMQPNQNLPQGQHPGIAQQQRDRFPLQTFTSQQQFQAPRGPQPTSQHQHSSQAVAPQRYQPPVQSSSISQPVLPGASPQPPRSWISQPFQFPRLSQQPLRPPPPLHPQAPLSLQPQRPQHQQQPRQPQQPPGSQQPQVLQQPLQPQQQLTPLQQFQPLQSLYQRQQQPQQPHTQQQLPASSQPQLKDPLQPQKMAQVQPPLQPQQQSQPLLPPQNLSQFQKQSQQQQQQSQPPHQVQHSNQQFQQPPQFQQQFPHPQPRELAQHPQQFQPTRQLDSPQLSKQQQFHSPIQPPQGYQQPLPPQKQSQYSQPLPLQQQSQQPVQGQQFPQKTPQPQNVAKPEVIPQVPSQIGQISGVSRQQPISNTPSQPSMPGLSQKYTGYSPAQQAGQPGGGKSSQRDNPYQIDKKGAQVGQPSHQQPRDGFPSQHTVMQPPGASLLPHNPSASSSNWAYPQTSQPLPSTGAPFNRQPLSRQDSKEQQQGFRGMRGQGVQQLQSNYPSQGWPPSPVPQPAPQEHLRKEQAVYPPGAVRQTSSDYGKQYPQQNIGGSSSSSSYPPYSGSPGKPVLPGSEGSQPYSFSQGSAPSSPLVQGVRPSPTSTPSSAYANSYSVSVAQAQLSQQQQMQQLQTQMLLQQQQLILQQQELLRHQQQQQQHDSDQGHIAQLFQQILQQQSKLTEMEKKLKDREDHEIHDDEHDKEHVQEDLEGVSPCKQSKEVTEKDLHSPSPQNSSGFSSSWSSGLSHQVNSKLDMDQIFNDLAKKQISEISEKGKHEEGEVVGSKPTGNIDSDIQEPLMKKSSNDRDSVRNGEEVSSVNSPTVTEQDTATESAGHGILNNTKGTSPDRSEQKSEDEASTDSTSLKEKKSEGNCQETETSSERDKEKERLREVEEQIQKIKDLQKNSLSSLPPKQQYLYEPGKLPETCQLPVKQRDSKPAVDPSKPSLHRQCGHYYQTQQSGASIGQDENNECLSDEEYLQKLCRTVETFEALVVNMEQRRENAPYNGFIHEWKVLEKMQETDAAMFSTQAATLNSSKNRYRDILPWDHSRVTLDTKEGGDYINASAIKRVTPLSPDYILTQGPIAATLGDFWLMVWEQKSTVIVMLTKEVEGNRLKCHQYWPIDEGHTVVYGAMRVHMRSLNHCQAWIERIMHVQHAESDELLVVTHLQFVGWPDHGVPHSPSDLLTFLSEVRNQYQENDPNAERPLLVHCSAGVGRAGTFCVIYTAICELVGTGLIVNIPKLVRNFRKHRKLTVQKKEQYQFCYRAILFYANQFIQLEKTAIEFKKKKIASTSDIGDVNVAPSMTLLDADGHRKPDGVSFLGEISDEDSSDDDSKDTKSYPGLEPREVEDRIRESQSFRAQDGSQDAALPDVNDNCEAQSAAKDTANTCEDSVGDGDRLELSERTEEKYQPQEVSKSKSASIDVDDNKASSLEAVSGNTDVSTRIDNEEEQNAVQDSSQSNYNVVNAVNEIQDISESPVADEDPSATITASPNEDNRKTKTCAEDDVEESGKSGLGEVKEETASNDRKGKEVEVQESKTRYSVEEEILDGTERDGKETDVKGEIQSGENAQELQNVDLPARVNTKQAGCSDLSMKEIDSQVVLNDETLKQQEKQQNNIDSTPQDRVGELQSMEEQFVAESWQRDEGSGETNPGKTYQQKNDVVTDKLLNEEKAKSQPAQDTEESATTCQKDANVESMSKTDNEDDSPQHITE